MRKFIKGFTLIELVIVMAILVILMSAIMNMFKPLRETYVDSTLYESQRTAQNGIITYVTESVRYATDMGVYNDSVSNASAAVNAFAAAYCTKYGITDTADISAVTSEIQKNAEIIIIDNTDTTYNNKTCYGRVVRRKVDGTATISDDYKTNPTRARLALGAPYYGGNSYSINIDATNTNKGVLAMTVASTSNFAGRGITKTGETINSSDTLDASKLISVSGSVVCKNLTSATSGDAKLGVKTAGMYDTASYNGSSTTRNTKTFIVYIDGDTKSTLRSLVA